MGTLGKNRPDFLTFSESYNGFESSYHQSKDESVAFLREAFGARTCCTVQSWALVFAFAKMVYSCCLLGLLSLTVLGVLLSSSSHKKNNVPPTDMQMSPNLSSPIPTSKEKTLLVLAVVYFVLQICVAFSSSKIFGIIAQLRGNFLPKLRRILGVFVILKITSLGILVPFFILNNNNNVPKGGNNGADGGNLRMVSSPPSSNPMGTLGLAFTSCDTAFTLVYVLVLALFVIEGSKGSGKRGQERGVVVVKVGGGSGGGAGAGKKYSK
ncbi:uncharacterized protein LOC118437621 [Folsomia candida]|uniref:Uncharacterized protein n=1 Tax=Folsomia candida TaxID=158441 RepID=A0A226DPS4_FOLCA|nr:uncharacterized protein LOC118437621 [Folsomia candida]OXA47080.1 hypothetical protein Fcan01_18345 [Folsomia candida]